jgi:hypothetical protein
MKRRNPGLRTRNSAYSREHARSTGRMMDEYKIGGGNRENEAQRAWDRMERLREQRLADRSLLPSDDDAGDGGEMVGEAGLAAAARQGARYVAGSASLAAIAVPTIALAGAASLGFAYSETEKAEFAGGANSGNKRKRWVEAADLTPEDKVIIGGGTSKGQTLDVNNPSLYEKGNSPWRKGGDPQRHMMEHNPAKKSKIAPSTTFSSSQQQHGSSMRQAFGGLVSSALKMLPVAEASELTATMSEKTRQRWENHDAAGKQRMLENLRERAEAPGASKHAKSEYAAASQAYQDAQLDQELDTDKNTSVTLGDMDKFRFKKPIKKKEEDNTTTTESSAGPPYEPKPDVISKAVVETTPSVPTPAPKAISKDVVETTPDKQQQESSSFWKKVSEVGSSVVGAVSSAYDTAASAAVATLEGATDAVTGAASSTMKAIEGLAGDDVEKQPSEHAARMRPYLERIKNNPRINEQKLDEFKAEFDKASVGAGLKQDDPEALEMNTEVRKYINARYKELRGVSADDRGVDWWGTPIDERTRAQQDAAIESGKGKAEHEGDYGTFQAARGERYSLLRPFLPYAGTDYLLSEQDNPEADAAKIQNLLLGQAKPLNFPLGNVSNKFWIQNKAREGMIFSEPLNPMPVKYQGGSLTDGATLYGSVGAIPDIRGVAEGRIQLRFEKACTLTRPAWSSGKRLRRIQ